ncbi:MAG: CHRD domain-containing protein [Acidimicrobiia bacterium]
MKRRSKIIAGSGALAAVLTFGGMGIAAAGHTNVVLEAELDGRQEVNADGSRARSDSDGSGEAYVFGIDGDAKTLCYVLTVDRIRPATAAHIHEAVKGQAGPVVVNLAAPADGNAADCLTEGEAGKFVGDQTVADILAHPENYYVNVHNEKYPSGAIRGQLEVQG